MSEDRKAFFYALSAVLLWSTVATAFKISLKFLLPIELLFYSSLASCSVLLSFVMYQKKFKALLGMSKKDWILSVKLGFLNPFLYYLVLLNAYDLLPAQKAQAINYTWAITLSLLSIPLLKQKMSPIQFCAVLVGYVGVVIIGSGQGDANGKNELLGILLAVASTIIWALYWIANTKDTRDPVVGLLANFLCGLPFIVCFMFFRYGEIAIHLPSLSGFLGTVYVGFFEMGIAFICWLIAMKKSTDTVNIANLIFLSPIFSLFFIHFILGETILITTVVGLVFILGGLFLQAKATSKKM